MNELDEKAFKTANKAWARCLDPLADDALRVAIRAYLAAAPAPAVSVEAICKSCGQQFPIDAEHDCPGLFPAPTVSGDTVTVPKALLDQFKNDLASAHAEIMKLQGADPANFTWPEWSPQANTLRWIDQIIASTYPAPTRAVSEITIPDCPIISTSFDEVDCRRKRCAWPECTCPRREEKKV